MAVTDDIGWVAVDLDGTLAETVWPDPGIGSPIVAMVELVRTLRHEGNRIAIYTSRSWWDAPRIERWAYLHDIPFDTVVCGKFLASTYIDDRLAAPPGSCAAELPWAAGLFDGEGCFSVAKKGPNSHARATVTQKDRRVLDRFMAAVGLGSIYESKNPAPWRWQTTSHLDTVAVLKLLYPWLDTIKREQGQRAIQASTWHNGHKDQLRCKNSTHKIGRRANGSRMCLTCQTVYQREYKRNRRG